jgi:FkbM family methyltransferase
MQNSSHPDLIHQIADQHFENASELVHCYMTESALPPLKLRSGLTLYHAPSDPVPFLIREIFHEAVYTNAGFYIPSDGDFIIDCGANIGVFALYLLSLNSRLRILCIEPCSSTRERLLRNIEQNKLTMVQVLPYGLYSHDARAHMSHAQSSGENALQPFCSSADSDAQEEISCLSLASLIRRAGDQPIDFLKIDIEGAELAVLQTAANVDWKRVRRIALEYHNYLVPQCSEAILGLLAKYGFTEIECIGGPDEGIIRARQDAS